MNRRFILTLLLALFFITVLPVQAQQAKKVHRLGILRAGAPPDRTLELFLRSLRELGYVEGKNIALEIRFAEGNRRRSAELARELVQLNVDALFTSGTRSILDLKKATSTIPIVMVSTSDPIGTGMIVSLARPGGNITGMSLLASDLWPKRLEILREILPKLSKAAMVWNKSNAGMSLEANATFAVAGPMGVTLQDRGMKDPGELETIFAAVTKDHPDGVLALMDLSLSSHRKRILEFLTTNRIPAIFEDVGWVEAGGLISYGPNREDVFRRAAVHMDKILKGAKPADIPVEQPMKFDLVVNLKTAHQISVTIPQWTLMKADRVIK